MCLLACTAKLKQISLPSKKRIIMKKFSYDDWLNDRMDDMDYMTIENIEGVFLLGANKLHELCYSHKLISEEDYLKIRKHQEETYDMLAVLYREKLIRKFDKRLKNLEFHYKRDKIKREILALESDLCISDKSIAVDSKRFIQKRDAVDTVLEGIKQFKLIKGSEYFAAKREHENLKDGKVFNTVWTSTDSYIIKAKLDYLKHLRRLTTTQKFTGLESMHDECKLKAVYKIAIKEKLIECSEEDFIAAFTPQPLPVEFKGIKWLIESHTGRAKGSPHLGALREFVAMAMYGDYKAKNVPMDVSHLFVDNTGRTLKLSKPKKTPSFHLATIEKTFRAKLK